MKRILSLITVLALVLALAPAALAEGSGSAAIEEALNLANNPDQQWTYSNGSWILSVVSAVTAPVMPDNEGVSVCVPGAYVVGIDTNGDGKADVVGEEGAAGVYGSLVIDYEAEVKNPNGQTYTASTCPVIITTGAAGYGAQTNKKAATTYAQYGYVAVACGNRGKQSAVKDEDGNVLYYTGDAPSCLADQKAAARYVRYNIILGNLPGSLDYWVSTGGSGGAAHASMFAATSDNPDFYDYQIEVGAVGVYKLADGTYSTTVTVDGKEYDLSDGAWGSVAYSTISSLYEGDMAQAFEYFMDETYEFNSPFQARLAEYLSQEYMDYINAQGLTVREADVGFDLDGDGAMTSEIPLSIEYDIEKYPDTCGYGGTYLDLYLAEFTENLQWYVDNLDYAEGWTWFNADGSAKTDAEVAAMTDSDRAECFIKGLYAKAGSKGFSGPVGTPKAGTTQSSGSSADSKNYASYEEMSAAYSADTTAIAAGDKYGKNLVSLYNPLNYIGAEGTNDPVWTRIVMGAVEGDMPLMTSLNLQLKWLEAGTDAEIEWQWNGSHVPSEIFGNSLALYVDQMYGKYVSGVETKKAELEPQTNGTATEAGGTDISSWVSLKDGKVSFTLADVLAYRNTGASKAVPGFDTIDLGQEDYVFGNSTTDARHWDEKVAKLYKEQADSLKSLFNLSSQAEAVVSRQTLKVNGTAVSAQVYNINGYNYVRLRDVAAMLNNTSAKFNVEFDEASFSVVLTPGAGYTGALAKAGGENSTGILNSQKTVMNGVPVRDMALYNIDGYNYIQLRSLASILGFAIDYDQATDTANITTSK